METHTAMLKYHVHNLQLGNVRSPEDRKALLEGLKASMRGRQVFWGQVARPFPVVKTYMNEVRVRKLTVRKFAVSGFSPHVCDRT